ncbi:MAG: succinyldiaminopimelate transaminase [Granulosicoccus sp.]
MNPDLAQLQPYPFEKLRQLLEGITPANVSPVALSVGEPKHPAPQVVIDTLTEHLRGIEQYPSTRGIDALRETIATWLAFRFCLKNPALLAEQHILPLNGTREGLFAIGQCLLDRSHEQRDVLMPNPFYQIYEGAALLAGCTPAFYSIDNNADANLDSISDDAWNRCQLIYICTPGNPTGAVLSESALQALIERAHRHDFIIISDECYSEIYRESVGPPTGLLQAAASMGNGNFERCLVFHSLSKRSNLPGMRSGFIAGDAALIKRFLLYRTYHGCSMSTPIQLASIAAWSDEQHVQDNRAAYDAKYSAVVERLQAVLDITIPPAGFYLWPKLNVDDQLFTQALFRDGHVRVVPGSFLARSVTTNASNSRSDGNPGSHHVRLALVAPIDDCLMAIDRFINCLDTHATGNTATASST